MKNTPGKAMLFRGAILLWILLAGVLAPCTGFAQFTGGSNGGQVFGYVINASCPVANNSPFSGGIAEGHASQAVINVVCTPTNNNPFGGGIAQGHASQAVINSLCTPANNSPFSGGIADGHASQAVINTLCTPTNNSPFSGGIADGHASQAVINTLCTPTNNNPFGGGIADGHASQAVINTLCTPNNNNPFSGGIADGHASQAVINAPCTAISNNPYGGGKADGHARAARIVMNPLDCASPLPVKLMAFTAECNEGEALLAWTTATESNNDYFTISRSADGTNFKDIGTVEGAGNSSAAIEYTYTDKNPYDGITYYRLKQTDLDGTFALLKVIAIQCQGTGSLALLLHPNPVSELLHIRITDGSGPWELMVLNAQGGLVYRGEITGRISYETESLAPGIYVVQVTRPGEDGEEQRLIKRFIRK